MNINDLNKAISEALGEEPRYHIMVMNPEETSYCADVSNAGPWWSEKQLSDWLTDEQKRGRFADYHIVRRQVYKRRATDVAAAWELGIEMDWGFEELCDWFGNMYQPKQRFVRADVCNGEYSYCGYAPFDSDADKAAAYAEARCRAWLAAKKRTV